VQVFANVLNNAAKYTDPGGAIELRADRREGEVTMRIRDNGIGIAPEVLPHVFELFVQAPRALDRAQGGLGIGLTLVKTLVEMQGGRVAAHSAGEGRGSEFTITLPIAASPADQASRAAGERQSAAELRILLVDDNHDSAEMLAEILRLWGHAVQVADDGAAALRLAAQDAFDVIVLDIGLPGLDGYEVARRLRTQSTAARVIALSGYGDADHRRRAEEAGFDGYLVKPADPDEVREILAAPPGDG
jgi:CheY-like chemotaxis protein